MELHPTCGTLCPKAEITMPVGTQNTWVSKLGVRQGRGGATTEGETT